MKKYRTSRIKGFMIGILAFLLTFGVGTVFAYWAGIITGANKNDGKITTKVGTGDTVETEILYTPTNGSKTLVPLGRGDVDSVHSEELSFTMVWQEAEEGNTLSGAVSELTLTIDQSKITINGVANNNGLNNANMFTVTNIIVDAGNGPINKINKTYTIPADTEITITFTLTFAVEPMDLAIYNSIINEVVTVPIVLAVAQIPNP